MVALNFDASTVEPAGTFTLLPPGRYVCKIIASEMKPTSDQTGQYLELKHEVLDGEHQGSIFTNNLNLDHANPQTVEIAYKTLSAICRHVGKIKIKDSSELHDIPLIATLAVRAYTKRDGTQGSSNDVKGYDKATDSSISTSAPAAVLPSVQSAAQSAASTGNRPLWSAKK